MLQPDRSIPNVMKELTKAEEQVMQVLWELKVGFVKELVEKLPDPKPAYNTVSTIIRILEKKGFVDHKAYGKSFQYYPLVDKETYSKQAMQKMVSGYFEGSYSNVVSFFMKEEKMSVNDLEEMLKMLKEQEQNSKND